MPKILCLHGAHSSGSNFKVQLLPVAEGIAAHHPSVQMVWPDGPVTSIPPEGYADYYGAPPLYRHIDSVRGTTMEDMLYKLRDMTKDRNPEQSMRTLVSRQKPMEAESLTNAMNHVLKVLESDPEIDGLLGYSEGAMLGASVILEEARLHRETGRSRQVKFGIFFAGWPPLRVNGDDVEPLMIDSSDLRIDIPTLHVIGSSDPFVHGGITLYSMCEEEKATLFDHAKGHTVPRDWKTVAELAEGMGFLWDKDVNMPTSQTAIAV